MVRLVVEDKNINEVTAVVHAQALADAFGLDLIQITDAEVPVCKIMDANKYLYELKQSEKIKAKKQRESKTVVKEIQLSMEIQEHDMQIKIKQAMKFMQDDKTVNVQLKMHGRALANPQMIALATEKLTQFATALQKKVDITRSGNTFSMLLKK